MPAAHPLDYQPYPTVSPEGAPQRDFEHIDASPDAFGGAIARTALIPDGYTSSIPKPALRV